MNGRRAALLLALALLAPSPSAADETSVIEAAETIVVEAARLVPPVLSTVTGRRVEFVNRAQRGVHVEFGGDGREHSLVTMPAGGPVWAVFHRPGTHPYVVHVYDGRRTRTLSGVVEVREDATHKWNAETCGVIVMGECIEP